MEINKELNNGELIIKLSGRLDTFSAPQLEEVISDLSDLNTLVFDLKNLVYISSAGLRILLTAQKKMNRLGKMKIINVSEDVMDILEMTGFSSIMTIEQLK